jgi:hypothetical protein
MSASLSTTYAAAVAFFAALGLEVQGDGPTSVEGQWVDRVVGHLIAERFQRLVSRAAGQAGVSDSRSFTRNRQEQVMQGLVSPHNLLSY